MSKKSDTTTFIVRIRKGGLKRVTVPSDWNLTFGQLVPNARSGQERQRYSGSEEPGYGLRFYEGAKTTGKTMMVISGVCEFWPEGIEIQEQHIETKRQTMGEFAPEGMKNAVVEAVVTTWRSATGEEESPNNRFLEQMEE